MKHKLPYHFMTNPQHIRSGVSLIEVIVSMMIMSIGVALLATLLPISILRTAQATQLTQAVFLRNNAESLLISNPPILNDSSISVGLTLPVGPNPTSSNTNHNVRRAVIDPLGFFTVDPSGTSPVFWTSSQVNPVTNLFPMLPRVSCASAGVSKQSQAAAMAQLPDSWSVVAEGEVSFTSGSPPTISMASVPTLNLYNSQSIANNVDFAQYRLVLYDITGSTAVIKPLYQQPTATTFSWWDVAFNGSTWVSASTGSSLPANFTPVRGKIEVLQRRFTWLMTVANQRLNATQWSADVNVAVFFNRAFDLNDETPFLTTFTLPGAAAPTGGNLLGGYGFDGQPGVRNVDDDANGVVDDASEVGWRGSDDRRTVTVQFNPSVTPKPSLKKGGFMFEPNSVAWYRIVDTNVRVQTAATTYVDLLLDTDVRYDSSVTVPTNNVISLAGIFMKGVVDVYPLSSITGNF